MTLSELHLLLSWQCTRECDHCFVWGSPWQRGTMTLGAIREILRQARDLGTIEWIYFEGGEPFLFFPVLDRAVEEATGLGFRVGLVTNSYWATAVEDAGEWLRGLAGKVQDLSLSCDLFHGDEEETRRVGHVVAAADNLGIPTARICIARPADAATPATGGPPQATVTPEGALTPAAALTPVADRTPADTGPSPEELAVMYRGRAVEKLAGQAPHRQRWEALAECPHEDLRDPGRVHVDPLGNVHVCQGISVGNLFRTPLDRICREYDVDAHPITGPLRRGGPAELVRRHGLPHQETYADACHLCYEARLALRAQFPDVLAPDQMYGVPGKA